MSLNKQFIEFVKIFGCGVCNLSPVDAHHLDTIGMGGNRKRDCMEDFSCVPLCREHHQEWHRIGDTSFYNKYEVNLWKVNYKIYKMFKKEQKDLL